MNRKQRKIKRMIARFHTGHTAIVPIQKLLGKECMLRAEYCRGSTTDQLARILSIDRSGDSILIYCPYLESVGFGHNGNEVHRFTSDLTYRDIDKIRPKKHGCWWISKYDVRII
ncbi:hypothetical protein Aci011_116 [Acinetobacter phage vB_AbaM_B09_Aci01-1]|uniref:Uncharacterized protein n=2 Tax=Saclayvirus TaxID=2733128 RepID=A0A386KMX6_9CAUD|nr:hypothetical protein HOU29_gp065 [Acinetobacter phage vB_AbaM_B09_Aci01-1]YP_009813339.1 hypothetical protein HOU30_gp073 [Acinetobacter phage vB_AbaM_B09_Aci02-2]AYD85619.1 hypothetical protein Aci011_116 [Acinetobacter phage vB_AbaM_B09_Aci01-1]AYD85781.1 hypothetical protein Aci022_117 [Acinetobacter phage vB_AbaM_B09_Aci02-2]UYL86232.1 hypothetical protein [Acinetobacter phage vB_AbaM_CP14]